MEKKSFVVTATGGVVIVVGGAAWAIGKVITIPIEAKKEVFIPNKEVRYIFEDAVSETEWKEVMTAIVKSEQLMKDTPDMKSEKVAEAVSYVHANATSLNKYNDENSLSCAITLAYYSTMNDYRLIRELPSGVGYADVVFVPRLSAVDKPAIVVDKVQ